MSERTSKAATNIIVEPPSGPDDSLDFTRAASTVVDGWTAFGSELLSYAHSAVQANLDVADELRRCTSPKDIAEVQTRYARRAVERYLDQVQQIGGLWTRVSSDAFQALSLSRGE